MTTTDPLEIDALQRLNNAYLDNVATGNVEGFRRILADDFLGSMPDGTLLTKDQFLARTGGPRTLSRLTADDVRIRILGPVAIIHAETHFTTLGGQEGRGRYTDIWEKRGANWLAVAAHVTRL
jgi:ketosteroid isomerase-like protein